MSVSYAAGSAPKQRSFSQASRLLPDLFAGMNPKRMRVLESGPACPDTIDFFSQVCSRIHVFDFFSEPVVRAMQSELSEAELKYEFQKLMNFKVGTLIDICLFWDFLNYLNSKALRAFSAALKPYIHPGTRGHGFSVLNVETPLSNQRYGITDFQTISVRPSRNAQLDYYPHSHEELNRSLTCFKVGRGWLLPDGRLEILLEPVL